MAVPQHVWHAPFGFLEPLGRHPTQRRQRLEHLERTSHRGVFERAGCDPVERGGWQVAFNPAPDSHGRHLDTAAYGGDATPDAIPEANQALFVVQFVDARLSTPEGELLHSLPYDEPLILFLDLEHEGVWFHAAVWQREHLVGGSARHPEVHRRRRLALIDRRCIHTHPGEGEFVDRGPWPQPKPCHDPCFEARFVEPGGPGPDACIDVLVYIVGRPTNLVGGRQLQVDHAGLGQPARAVMNHVERGKRGSPRRPGGASGEVPGHVNATRRAGGLGQFVERKRHVCRHHADGENRGAVGVFAPDGVADGLDLVFCAGEKRNPQLPVYRLPGQVETKRAGLALLVGQGGDIGIGRFGAELVQIL